MYRTICTELWTDPKVKALPPDSKLLFLYLITNPHTHLSGIYYLPTRTMEHETGLSRRGIDGALMGLMESKQVIYDTTHEQIFVIHMFAYQGRGQKTDKGVADYLLTLHHSSLLPHFIARYPTVKTYLVGSPIDGASMGDTDFPSPVPDPLLRLPNHDLKSTSHTQKKGQWHTVGSPCPDDFAPSEEHVKLAKARGLELNLELLHFKGKAMEAGWTSGNWNLKFRNWMLQEVKFRQARRAP